jgi:hypothetical protein
MHSIKKLPVSRGVGVCIALHDRLQLIGTYFYSIWRVIAYFQREIRWMLSLIG